MKKTKEMNKIKNNKTYVGASIARPQHRRLDHNKGITLIALIITIIVMLILVSVTISMAINGGLFEYAGKSVSDTENAINKEQELAGGQVQIDGEWYDSIDDFLAGVESVKSLQEKHEFTYYSSLGKAVTDVNNNTRENADAEKENAVAGIYTEDGKHTVVLLKDTTENARINLLTDMTLNLGGNVLSVINDKVGINMPSTGLASNTIIDGRLTGSTVQLTGINGENTKTIQVVKGKMTVNGGTYIANSDGAPTNACIYISLTGPGEADISNATLISKEANSLTSETETYGINNAGKVIVTNCKISVTTKNGDVIAVGNYGGGNTYISACKIDAKSVEGSSVIGVSNGEGMVTATNCDIKAYSNYLYGSETYYSALSIGIINLGKMTINNCNVMGTHSGVQNEGTLYVNGGTYEGFGHGGFYFAGKSTTSYVRNAAIRECAMPEGYTQTAGDNDAGFYVGGNSTANNIKVYMHNCDIYGSREPIVLRGSSGEQNNVLYISNSRINTDQKIRIDSNHKLYLGKGNNFTADNTNNPTAVVKTEEVYVQE